MPSSPCHADSDHFQDIVQRLREGHAKNTGAGALARDEAGQACAEREHLQFDIRRLRGRHAFIAGAGALARNGAIGACGNCGQCKHTLEFLRELRYDRVAPNRATIGAVRACAKGMQRKHAWEHLREMSLYSVAPDVITFAPRHALEEGVGAFARGETGQGRAEFDLLQCSVLCWCKGSARVHALELLRECMLCGVTPSISAYRDRMQLNRRWNTCAR